MKKLATILIILVGRRRRRLLLLHVGKVVGEAAGRPNDGLAGRHRRGRAGDGHARSASASCPSVRRSRARRQGARCRLQLDCEEGPDARRAGPFAASGAGRHSGGRTSSGRWARSPARKSQLENAHEDIWSGRRQLFDKGLVNQQQLEQAELQVKTRRRPARVGRQDSWQDGASQPGSGQAEPVATPKSFAPD